MIHQFSARLSQTVSFSSDNLILSCPYISYEIYGEGGAGSIEEIAHVLAKLGLF
jgi:hypothetical protein